MNVDIRSEIINRVLDTFRETSINCPECESMCEHPQYTCTTCWCEGGGGTIMLDSIISGFELYGTFKT